MILCLPRTLRDFAMGTDHQEHSTQRKKCLEGTWQRFDDSFLEVMRVRQTSSQQSGVILVYPFLSYRKNEDVCVSSRRGIGHYVRSDC